MPDRNSGRVAMLAHTCYLTDARIRREAEALAGNGVEVHVVSLMEEIRAGREPREAIHNGVHIHRLHIRRKRGNFLRYLFEYFMTGLLGGLKLAQLHFRSRLDVVHVHNMPDLLVLAGIIPWLSGSRLVLDVHDPMPELYMSWHQEKRSLVVRLLAIQETVSCWLADRVVSVNETMRENLRSKGVADDKIFIVHNFPDLSHFQVCDIPESWPQSQNRLVLLYCGTITEHYDLGLAVKAMARLNGEVPIRLKIMGDGNKLAEVLDLASQLGVRDSIELVGRVPIEQVAGEMRKADVGISCHRDGIFGDLYFSTKIVEYLTQGLPVMSPRTCTIRKYLPEDCLFYFEPGNEASLAEAIRLVWHNPAEVIKRLAESRKSLARLSWQAEKDRFLGFYAELLGDAAATHGVASKPWRLRNDEQRIKGNSSVRMNGQDRLPPFVLVTPAHNEEALIKKTIESVISQTILPMRWVIVDDGSTDSTAAIVSHYLPKYPWIEMVQRSARQDRNFAGKVHAFNAGYESVRGLGYEIVGNLDADISFEADYLEFLLRKFTEDENLGVAGSIFVEEGYSSDRHSFEGHYHVAGGCQLFRKRCFEEIGGFKPNKAGGVDWVAVTTARMMGWKTKSFREKSFFHHRHLGTADCGALAALFDYGKRDYYLGGHPLWELFRVAYRMTKRPYLLGGLSLGLGYGWAMLRGIDRSVSNELMAFHRREQMRKLGIILKSLLTFKRVDSFKVLPDLAQPSPAQSRE